MTVGSGGLYRQFDPVLSDLNPDIFFVGYGGTGSGAVTVSGADGDGNRSALITRSPLHLGDAGDANMYILDGEKYILDNEYLALSQKSVIGNQENSNGYLTISGVNETIGDASTFKIVDSFFYVGNGGRGTIDVSDGDFYRMSN